MARSAGRRRPGSGRGRRRKTYRSSGRHLPRWVSRRFLLRWIGIPVGLWAAVMGLRESSLFYPVSIPYDRALYVHWIDADGDCRDSRQETLAAQSLTPARWSEDGCRVEAGRWRDPWSGDVLTEPGAVDIDHMVPLAEAHRSGAHAWTSERRMSFANDVGGSGAPGQLIATAASTNRSKADGDPLSWLPPQPAAWCAYVAQWRAVKRRWLLEADLLERLWTDAISWTCTRLRAGQRGS